MKLANFQIVALQFGNGAYAIAELRWYIEHRILSSSIDLRCANGNYLPIELSETERNDIYTTESNTIHIVKLYNKLLSSVSFIETVIPLTDVLSVRVNRTSDNEVFCYRQLQPEAQRIFFERNIVAGIASERLNIPASAINGMLDEHRMNREVNEATLRTILAEGQPSSVSAAVENTPSETPQSASTSTNSSAASQDGNDMSWLMQPHYETSRIYSSFGGYHDSHSRGYNQPTVSSNASYRVGIELEMYARNQDYLNQLTNARRNWFFCERDGSLHDSEHGVEFITIPLIPEDATDVNFWRPTMNWLRTHCNSKRYVSTGLHIHVGRKILGANEAEQKLNLAKLIYFYYKYIYRAPTDSRAKKLNVAVFGRDRTYQDQGGYNDSLCDELMRCADEQVPSSVMNELARKILSYVSSARYRDINIQNSNTIEFRKGKGIISESRMAGMISYVIALCEYVKSKTLPRDLNIDEFVDSCLANQTIYNIVDVRNAFPSTSYDEEV